MKLFSIPISEIRQFVFCPRIPFYHLILGINPKMPIWVNQGKNFHKNEEKLLIRRSLEKIGISKEYDIYQNILLKSDKLGIHGYIDGFIKNNEDIIPFENKMNLYKGNPAKGHKLQLTAYTLCLEEKFNVEINFGIIFFNGYGKFKKIDIDKSLKIELNNKINQIKDMLKKELLPSSSASEKQCTQCEYLNLCNDRF